MFRFSTRDLLWLTVLVALGVAWWVDHSRQSAARVAAEQQAKLLEAKDVEWREVNSWLTSALNEEGFGFGLPGEWKPQPPRTTPDSR
jgi:hypothetical protein